MRNRTLVQMSAIKGSFTSPISEADFAFLLKQLFFILSLILKRKEKSDESVNEP